MKHNKIAEWVMVISAAITVATVPMAIFVLPLYGVFFPIDVSMYQHVIGIFALLFGIIFVAVGLFMCSDSVIKKDDENET